ncbi:MAG: TolC family protein [Treponema sp.]|nr:TolC family protein [Treponema sp.]
MKKKRYIELMYIRSLLFFAVILVLCANIYAQETAAAPAVKLTQDEAVELAIRNNLSLESSRINLAVRRRASDLSWNQFIPTVDVGGALLRFNESQMQSFTFMGQTMTMGSSQLWYLSASLSVSLNFNIAMIEEMNRLRLDYEKGLISFEKAKIQLERDVRKAYHNMLLLQENIALLRGTFANVERQVQMAQANYNAGLAPELILLQARVARENMRPVIDQVENGLKVSMAQFAMFLGLPFDTQFELTPVQSASNYAALDLSEIISMASANRPEIRELRQDILMLNSIKTSTTFRLYTPTLSLSWNTAPSFSGDPWADPWFDFSRWREGQGMFRITLGFRLNGLIPFTSENTALKNLNDQLATANMGLAQLINGTQIEVYNTVLSLERTRLNAQAQAQTVSLAEQAYRLTEQAYRAGLQDYFQVQNAEQSLHQARVQLLEQQFNYLNGLIDLEYSIGVPFGTLSGNSAATRSVE